MSTLSYKSKIPFRNVDPNWRRLVNHFWVSRKSQVTTSNLPAMRSNPISGRGTIAPVHSDLQPHLLHRFNGDKNYSLLLCMKKESQHVANLAESSKMSVMTGHTDPQIFHWFKQLGITPPRSTISGFAELITPHDSKYMWDDVWRDVCRHPVVQKMAEEAWHSGSSKSPEEQAAMASRISRAERARMERMASPDWRAKHTERESDLPAEDDVEEPLFVIKDTSFQVVRLKQDVTIFTDHLNIAHRIREDDVFALDPPPLCRTVPRFINRLNFDRPKLMTTLNMTYQRKLNNVFIYDADEDGLWAMGTELDGKSGGVGKENWAEYRFAYGAVQTPESKAAAKAISSKAENENSTGDKKGKEKTHQIEPAGKASSSELSIERIVTKEQADWWANQIYSMTEAEANDEQNRLDYKDEHLRRGGR